MDEILGDPEEVEVEDNSVDNSVDLSSDDFSSMSDDSVNVSVVVEAPETDDEPEPDHHARIEARLASIEEALATHEHAAPEPEIEEISEPEPEPVFETPERKGFLYR